MFPIQWRTDAMKKEKISITDGHKGRILVGMILGMLISTAICLLLIGMSVGVGIFNGFILHGRSPSTTLSGLWEIVIILGTISITGLLLTWVLRTLTLLYGSVHIDIEGITIHRPYWKKQFIRRGEVNEIRIDKPNFFVFPFLKTRDEFRMILVGTTSIIGLPHFSLIKITESEAVSDFLKQIDYPVPVVHH